MKTVTIYHGSGDRVLVDAAAIALVELAGSTIRFTFTTGAQSGWLTFRNRLAAEQAFESIERSKGGTDGR